MVHAYRLPGATLIDVRVIETDEAQIKGIDIPTPCPVHAVLYAFTAQRNVAAAAQENRLLFLTLGTHHDRSLAMIVLYVRYYKNTNDSPYGNCAPQWRADAGYLDFFLDLRSSICPSVGPNPDPRTKKHSSQR